MDDYDFKSTYEKNHFIRKKQSNNSSGYKGVSWDATKNKWRVKIEAFGIAKRARFDKKDDAARKYNEWAIELYGENAVLNEIK